MIAQHAGRISATDICEYNGMLSPWEVRLVQVSGGEFRGQMDFVQIGEMLIYREHWTSRMLVDGLSPPNHFMFGLPIRQNGSTVWTGDEVNNGCIACAAPGSELNFKTPECATHLVVLVPKVRGERYLGRAMTRRLPKTAFARALDPAKGAATANLLECMIQRSGANTDWRLGPDQCEQLESNVLGILGALFRPPRANADSSTASNRWQVVTRARAWLDEQNSAITIEELAAAVGVSQRTLQYAFHETLGVTPVRFLRQQRLNAAHRALLDADIDSGATVTAIALQLGFSELGRFAGEHQNIFGESPSDTLRRRRRRNGGLIRRLHPA